MKKTNSSKWKTVGLINEMLKANRKASREAEFQLLGPGFHSRTILHRSAKTYTRKVKHKGADVDL